jgi:hypothetical protein
MALETGSEDWRDRKIREWLLLLLRFAITREPADDSAVHAFAEELDSVGLGWRPAAPSFFRRTSHEVCAAIQAAGAPQQTAVLRKHISRIADLRLQRAFAAAVGLPPSSLKRRTFKRSKRKDPDLWKGLPRK